MVGHPDPDIDVVAISINVDLLQKDQARFAFFALDEHTLRIADIKEHGISEGDFVYVLGFQRASFRQIGSMLLCVQV